jgi:2-polyprenyl-3-methyl-5-hydroxy-6-metoxy-1,4-benzoquinol methylase
MLCQATPTTEEALTARLVQSTTQALELLSIYLGKELGLYATLWTRGPMTATELARAAGVAPRYAREWLEQQSVAGFLEVDLPTETIDARRYALPAEHANVFVSDDHPAHLAPLALMVAGIGGALDQVVHAYRTGGGVPYSRYGAAFRKGQAGINRPAFLNDLVTRWIPAAADLHAALTSRPLRVADVGCGGGWSTLAMARAFPLAHVVGFDADAASIDDARGHAANHDVAVHFEVSDAATLAEKGPFDVVLVLEALHDMSRPLAALVAIRQALTPGGSVIVADENVAEHFHAPAGEIERLMYGWSVVHCLPVSLAEQPSAAIGAVIRPDIVRAMAAEAGLAHVEVLPVDAGFFRLYRLRAH